MISPRWNAGAIDSETTTWMGHGELVAIDNVFHSMKMALSVCSTGHRLRSVFLIAIQVRAENKRKGNYHR